MKDPKILNVHSIDLRLAVVVPVVAVSIVLQLVPHTVVVGFVHVAVHESGNENQRKRLDTFFPLNFCLRARNTLIYRIFTPLQMLLNISTQRT